ncbi:GntT/GntP/DsdX family permease [Nitrospirillum pindoramense]|uniref:GntP family gluconate:H+ symporter n=1 Tax=Nitrospirillum amazonense TaxID=28077 RepID=A0A560GUV2_9PROT|nr:gluconate:H+ symporter [Nitrospirillum amazonense]TWB37581.1 GntP family gluconate:H+ symporter [Nitrospirillum amazonense]
MLGGDVWLILAAGGCIVLAVVLIIRLKLHPFLALLCAALALAVARGMAPDRAIGAVQKGFGDIMGGAGLVVALGLTLGTMLQLSGAAASLAGATVGAVGPRWRPWGCLLASLVLGLPLFFETGVVLLLPIIAALPLRGGRGSGDRDGRQHLRLMLPALAGLSVLHALVPPHPGPIIAVDQLGAGVGPTLVLGVLLGLPIAVLAGPVFAGLIVPHVAASHITGGTTGKAYPTPLPSPWVALAVVLLPVVLIAAKAVPALGQNPVLALLGAPPVALLLANLVALAVFFAPRRGRWNGAHGDRTVVDWDALWHQAMAPAAGILLSIAGGGAFKQVLVEAGLADTLARIAQQGAVSPIVLAWGIAVLIRLATGSATVATITASGALSAVAGTSGVAPEWLVLAVGAGSLFFSHVNDPGFWLVKNYLGLSTADTLKTWSVMETIVSVTGLILVLAASHLF